jgi:PhnB protein
MANVKKAVKAKKTSTVKKVAAAKKSPAKTKKPLAAKKSTAKKTVKSAAAKKISPAKAKAKKPVKARKSVAAKKTVKKAVKKTTAKTKTAKMTKKPAKKTTAAARGRKAAGVKGKAKATKTAKKTKASKSKTKKVLAIPKGYNTVTPYLFVNRAPAAIDFYKKVFAAKEVMRMDRPDGKVAHAELKIGDAKIMLADECPEMNALSPTSVGGSPISIHLYVKDVDAVVKGAVVAGANLVKAVENMFYGDRSGAIVDPFGHTWYVSTHVEDVSNAKIRKRAADLYGNK